MPGRRPRFGLAAPVSDLAGSKSIPCAVPAHASPRTHSVTAVALPFCRLAGHGTARRPGTACAGPTLPVHWGRREMLTAAEGRWGRHGRPRRGDGPHPLAVASAGRSEAYLELSIGLVALAVALVIAAALLARRPAPAGDLADAAAQGAVQQTALQMEALRAQMTRSLEALAGRMLELERAMHGQVVEIQRNVNDGLEKTAAQLSTVQQSLVRTNELVRQVEEAGKEMAALQDILRPPKLRGQLGELMLGQVLRQVLPDGCFEEQYEFPRSRVRVDAVIRLSGGMVPVDSKFPMESCQRLFLASTDEERKRCRAAFLRDVRSHVDAIASKYILTDEGTFDFALMYVPAENLYYEIITGGGAGDDGVYAYALGRKVVPVSPNSFYAYLQAVALGLKGLRIERNAQQIMGHLSQLAGDLGKFQGEFETLGRHLANAHTKYDEADKRLARFGDRLQGLTGAAGLDGKEGLALASDGE